MAASNECGNCMLPQASTPDPSYDSLYNFQEPHAAQDTLGCDILSRQSMPQEESGNMHILGAHACDKIHNDTYWRWY